ncbi:MAG TPA: helix-turn-helix transcriptional regulator [Actinophytocola sp.]|uniref:helix-turn-helix domain-containing protein n=1 Tax=Actinophytocola sp. TaxID=1872138 RepID=UPI002DBDE30E|nr:helix-turn-helix transcriptional regulator [Actinophytocola sp.]HEU5471411.1 helix-turn-helix transcriptional regulator [Actinophytocola sp.]
MTGAYTEIGRKLRQIRHARGKSLTVIAGLAGISPSYLSRLENGERALDRRSLIVALADALEVAPMEITGVGAVTPGPADEDRSLIAVRMALMSAAMNEPNGTVQPAAVLGARVADVLDAQRDCRHTEVGELLPALIRDLHTTVAAGREEREVLRLIALLHVQGTEAWLTDVGASCDLGWQAAMLARQAAERLEDDQMTHAVAAFGTAFALLAAGAFDLAATTLAVPVVGTGSDEAMQVTGMLALTSSLVAAASGRPAERAAALAEAADLAERTGNGNAMWFGFGPSNVGIWRMSVALESGEYAEAARIAGTIDPDAIPSPTRRSHYWREYGVALARLPRRHTEAVVMLRRAERIAPARIHRHPMMRSVIAELLARSRRDAVGRELRGMAYRAGLPVQ